MRGEVEGFRPGERCTHAHAVHGMDEHTPVAVLRHGCVVHQGIPQAAEREHGFVGDFAIEIPAEIRGTAFQQSIRGQRGEPIASILGLDQRQGLQHDQECLGWMVGEFQRSADLGQGARPLAK
jgi:hypothetical protein